MSDFGDFYYDQDIGDFADEFGFSDDETAMELFNTGFLTSSDEDSDWYSPDVDADDRYDAREAFLDWIEEHYDDFDWDAFWEEWADMYEAA